MRKSFLLVVVMVFLASIGTMLGLYWRQGAELNSRLQVAEAQTLKQEAAQRLIFEMEQYRTINANFRRMSNEDISATKDHIGNSFKDITAELDQGSATDRATIAQIRAQFSGLQVLAAKLEPQMYSRNVYMNADIQQMHADIIKGLREIATDAKVSAEQARAGITGALETSKRLFAGASAASCAMMLLLMGYGYLMHSRPIRKLQERVAEIRSGKLQMQGQHSLSGIYGELEQLVRDFMSTITAHRRERLDFVTAVATDLRGPLHSVRGAAEVFASSDERLMKDPSLRACSVQATRNALQRLGAVLDGLNDILDSGEGNLKLDEQITDLGQLLSETAKIMKTDHREIEVGLPPLPVWARVDRARFEHLLIYLGSKFIDHEGEESRLALDVSRIEEAKGGLLITFYDQGTSPQPKARRGGAIQSSGPDQDLLKHWATQRGFGMAMADRIMRAHGGTVSAAGVAGTKLVFKISLPAERISMGVVSKNLTAFDVLPSVHPRN